VRVATITSAKVRGRDIHLEYIYDAAIPPIPDSKIQELQSELDVGGLNHTHWAVKNVDLYKVLMRHDAARGPSMRASMASIKRYKMLLPPLAFAGSGRTIFGCTLR
jgi:hypothetical protein